MRLAFFLFLVVSGAALACKCRTGSPFLENAMSGSVVVVKVTKAGGQRITVEVESQLAGPKLKGAVVVQGADGGNCNAGVGHFKVGQRAVMVLTGPAAATELSGCGVHWLSLQGSEASGAIDDGVDKLPLAELKQRVVEAQANYEKFTKGG